jgi:hypothetical protein
VPGNGGTVHNGLVAATVDQAPAAPKGRRFSLLNAGMILITAAALGLIVVGFASATTGDKSTTINDPAVERVIPHPGDLVLRQSEVGIDLAPGFRGVLIIDGQEIPVYDVNGNDKVQPGTVLGRIIDGRYDPGQNTVLFQPQEGATIQAFSPGRHKITAEYWRDGVETRDQAHQVTWFFSVS